MQREHLNRQIKICKAQYIRIKAHCVYNEKRITVFFDEVLRWFFKYLANGNRVVYEASKNEDTILSMRLSIDVIMSIKDIALNNKVSDARIIATALSLYLEHHPL